jgi:hypothetical protein
MVCAPPAQVWTRLPLDSLRGVYYWLWLAALTALSPQASPAAAVGVSRHVMGATVKAKVAETLL